MTTITLPRKKRSDCRQIELTCKRCNRPFRVQPSQAGAVYCSDACKFNLPGYRRDLTVITENGVAVGKRCVKCGEPQELQNFTRQAKGVLGYGGRCKNCRRVDSKKYHEQNRDRMLAYSRQYELLNKDKISARHAKRNAAIRRRVVEAYGGQCVCCGETELFFLCIDHIYGDGREHRRSIKGGIALYRFLIKHDFPKDRYQLLCFNCNCAKGFWGTCPHQAKPKAADFLLP